MTGVWEGEYNFFCQGTRSAGEADMKVLSLIILSSLSLIKKSYTEDKMTYNFTVLVIPVDIFKRT